jgi:adenylate cyclase
MARESAGGQQGNEQLWRTIFAVGHPRLKSIQKLHSWLPSPPRCRLCYAPFQGLGGFYMKLRGRARSNRNPRYCNACDKFLRAYPGGAEVELSMMFVDVRGSVPLAASMGPAKFNSYMEDFFRSATQALIDTDGFVIEFRGDCVVGVYPPGFSGPQHARKVVEAARHLLADIAPRAPDGSLLPIGVGAHTGKVYIGTVSAAEGGMQNITILGDNANIAARLSQTAAKGEALISQQTCDASGLQLDSLEARALQLAGKEGTFNVRMFRVATA